MGSSFEVIDTAVVVEIENLLEVGTADRIAEVAAVRNSTGPAEMVERASWGFLHSGYQTN